MDKSSNAQDKIKDFQDTPCHRVGHGSHFPLHTFESVRKGNRSSQSSWCHRLVAFIKLMHKTLCFVSVVKHMFLDRCMVYVNLKTP